MTTEIFGESGFSREAPNWITDRVEFLIRRAQAEMPKGYVITTVENEFGLALLVDNKHYATFTVEDRLQIMLRLQALQAKIEETGCPVWIDKE